MDGVMWWASELGKGEWALCITLALLVGAQRTFHRATLSAVALAVLLAAAGSSLLKDAVARPRPLSSLENVRVVGEPLRQRSFPSGHSANAFALCAACGGRLRTRRAWVVGGLLAGLVGLSRVYVGAHYPGDVLAGALLGVVCAGVALRSVAAWERRAANKVG